MRLTEEQRELLVRLERALIEEQRLARQSQAARTDTRALLVEAHRMRVPSVSIARAFARTRGDASPELRKRLQSVISTRMWRLRRRAQEPPADSSGE